MQKKNNKTVYFGLNYLCINYPKDGKIAKTNNIF